VSTPSIHDGYSKSRAWRTHSRIDARRSFRPDALHQLDEAALISTREPPQSTAPAVWLLLFAGQQTRNVQDRLAHPRRLVDNVVLGFVSRGFAQDDPALLLLKARSSTEACACPCWKPIKTNNESMYSRSTQKSEVPLPLNHPSSFLAHAINVKY
jgi:hypothetical protein